MIVVAISSYREDLTGPFLSLLPLLEREGSNVGVLVFEGPVGIGHHEEGNVVEIDACARRVFGTRFRPLVVARGGRWQTDAAKRTAMLQRAQAYSREPGERLWLLWLDGDEVLLWGEYLPDWLQRLEAETAAGGLKLRLVELDGSVVWCFGKIIDGDTVRAYLESSYQVELKSGMLLGLPNVPICTAGGIPVVNPDELDRMTDEEKQELMRHHRPPLAGEPHLLHRSILRDPARAVRRLSTDEAAFYEQALPELGPFRSTQQGVDR